MFQRGAGRQRVRRTLSLGAAVVTMLTSASLTSCCATPTRHHAASVTAIDITSPASDRAVGGGAVSMGVHVTGSARSVVVRVAGHSAALASRKGSDWSATLPASWLRRGRNALQVRASGANGSSAQAVRHVFRATTRADLGLRVGSSDHHGARSVTITSTALVGGTTVRLNGHDLTTRVRTGRLHQTLYLGGDEGLRAGRNTVSVTAVDAAGRYQQAQSTWTVSAGAPMAAATTEPGPAATLATGGTVQNAPRIRVGRTVRLDGTQSRASRTGAALRYAWSIARASRGSTATIAYPGRRTASFTPRVPGVYLLRLTVRESGRAVTSSDVTPVLAIANVPPIGEVLETQTPTGVRFAGTSYPPTAGQSLELVLIDRGTLAVSTFAGGASAGSISALAGDIATVTGADSYSGDGLVEVLTAPSGYACAPIAGACTAFGSLLRTLAVDTASSSDGTVHSGSPFSTITLTSASDTSVWRSSATPAFASPLLPGVTVGVGNLGGYLEYPLGVEAALFVPDTALPFTTSATSNATTNVMTFASCESPAVPSPPAGLPPCQRVASTALSTCGTGPTGGFQVVVLWAASLSMIANQTFTTNSGCGAHGVSGDASQLAAMTSLAAKYAANGGTRDYLVAVQSIGSPRPQTSSAAVNAAWASFGTRAVVPLGGTGSTFDYLGYGSGYALIGYSDTTLPGFGAPFAAETSGDLPHQGNTSPPAVLSGVLARNHRNDYYPQTYGPIAGAADEGLSAIATRPPSPWPVEDTPGELAAWQAFTTAIVAANDVLDWGPQVAGDCWGLDHDSIRDIYCNFTEAGNLTSIPSASSYQPNSTYTQSDWNAVIAEFVKEQGLVKRVHELLDDLDQPFLSGGSAYVDFTMIAQRIESELNRPTTAPVRSRWAFWLGIFSDITDVVGGFVGVPDAGVLAGAFLNAMSEGLNVGSQFVPQSSGDAQSVAQQKVQGEWSDVESDLPTIYQQAVAGLIAMEPILVTDWGKLVKAANVDETALSLDQYDSSITRATKAWGTPLLLSSVYHPDALVSKGLDVTNDHQYANGPYVGPADNFSCYYGRVLHGNTTFAPFADTAPGGEYLAGSPAQRYVLATSGDPSDTDTIPTQAISPDQPPATVLAPLFAPVTGIDDTTDLGLSRAQVYERDFGLGSGTTVTCPTSPGEPTGALAASSTGPGGLNVFYTFQPANTSTPVLENDYLDPQSGVWYGPGGLPGTPDIPPLSRDGQQAAPLAATASPPGQMHLFFLQHGTLVNDYDLGSGWQGPGPLPGDPVSANSGGGLAAVTSGSAISVFFWQGRNIVYDQNVGNGWGTVPILAVADAVPKGYSTTPLAAVATGSNEVRLFYVAANGGTASIMQVTSDGGRWSAPHAVVNGVDGQTALAATTDGDGHPVVLYTSGGNGNTTTLHSSTNDGTGWTASSVAGGQCSPSVAAASALPFGATTFVLPCNGHQNNSINTYGWDPTGGWARSATAPVPYIVGTFPN